MMYLEPAGPGKCSLECLPKEEVPGKEVHYKLKTCGVRCFHVRHMKCIIKKLTARFEFHEQKGQFTHVDAATKDLILQTVVFKPHGRLTIGQVKKHEFFKGFPWPKAGSPLPVLSEMIGVCGIRERDYQL